MSHFCRKPVLQCIKKINPWVKYLFIALNQPPSKIFFQAPPDRKILDPYLSVDMVPPVLLKLLILI